jgi:hypothetical protein
MRKLLALALVALALVGGAAIYTFLEQKPAQVACTNANC